MLQGLSAIVAPSLREAWRTGATHVHGSTSHTGPLPPVLGRTARFWMMVAKPAAGLGEPCLGAYRPWLLNVPRVHRWGERTAQHTSLRVSSSSSAVQLASRLGRTRRGRRRRCAPWMAFGHVAKTGRGSGSSTIGLSVSPLSERWRSTTARTPEGGGWKRHQISRAARGYLPRSAPAADAALGTAPRPSPQWPVPHLARMAVASRQNPRRIAPAPARPQIRRGALTPRAYQRGIVPSEASRQRSRAVAGLGGASHPHRGIPQAPSCVK